MYRFIIRKWLGCHTADIELRTEHSEKLTNTPRVCPPANQRKSSGFIPQSELLFLCLYSQPVLILSPCFMKYRLGVSGSDNQTTALVVLTLVEKLQSGSIHFVLKHRLYRTCRSKQVVHSF